MPAHIAGKAMARQGRFDAFHLEAMRAFFTLNQNLQDPEVLRQVAVSVGADIDRFDQDVADPELKELVWREFTTGVERDRVTAIPTLFAGERRVVEGALSLDRYRQLFETVLAEAERSV
jgi:predicted DsbA family dithiol-disulfide isomerase